MASADRATEAEEYVAGLYRPSLILPIAQHKRALQYMVETTPVTIVVGETGSGKTTQLPQFLHEAGWTQNGRLIACTQPRRVAATTVATRVADEMGVRLGEEVGYAIRFEDVTSSKTRIKYMTDGMLLREILVDPLLRKYSVIMVDEAHERSVSTDILLGLLKKIRRKRKELRLIISSATLQAEEFQNFFLQGEKEGDSDDREVRDAAAAAASAASAVAQEDKDAGKVKTKESGAPPQQQPDLAKIVGIGGRCYPVDVLYLEKPTEDYVERTVETVFDIHLKEGGGGDVLAFLTGREEIENAIADITERSSKLHPRAQRILALPLYAGLSSEQQLAVFDAAPEGHRKVIFATNVAEASVTIDGVVFVVDCGFVKLRYYDPKTGIESLVRCPVSKASAKQRAGRAGRTKPGKCFRLYTEEAFNEILPDITYPEIQRTNLAPIILQLKSMGIDNVVAFEYLTPPSRELMVRALELLYSLGALDDYAKLTRPLGVRMSEIPVEPMLSKTLLNSVELGCFSQILSIAAMTTVQNVFIQHEDSKRAGESKRRLFSVEEGDHLTLLNVYIAFTTKGQKSAKWCRDYYLNFKALSRAVAVRGQLWRYLQRFYPDLEKRNCELATAERIRKCLVTGYFAHAAKMQSDGTYRIVGSDTVLWPHPSSIMFNRTADWVIFHEVVETNGKAYIRDITKIEKNWLTECAPEYYKVREPKRDV